MPTTRSLLSTTVFLTTILQLAILLVANAWAQVADSAKGSTENKTSSEQELELLTVLRSEAPASEKAITCKRLAIHGSSAAVPDLAPLLQDPRLASWARTALEAIPGTAADEALRQAVGSLQGRLLIGTINSIGVRKDANAVTQLTTRLQDQDVAVASAAAVALGHIGNDAATESLRRALRDSQGGGSNAFRSAVAEGCVLCAERLVAAGKSAAAAELYDQVRKAAAGQQRTIEATRGAILARGQAGIPLLLEQFRSPSKPFFQLALSIAREFPGSEIDQALVAELGRAQPERAALMVVAMADREETVRLTAVLDAAAKGPQQVRRAAIDALGRIGDVSCLPVLMPIAIAADGQLAEAAKATLARLPGEQVDAQIIALFPDAADNDYQLLIELVGLRRIAAMPELLKGLDHADSAVRHAALAALGETVTLDGLPVLVTQVVAPKHREDAVVAQQALQTASVRMPDREACAAQLSLALESAPATTQSTLLEILGAVGGTKALHRLGVAAKSDSDQLQDTASRLLGKWNSLDAAPVLLDLAKTAPGEKYQVRALRGYIGLARKFAMPAPQRAEMCQRALDVAQRPAEQKLVLDVLKLHPSAETLKLAIRAMELPELKNEATQVRQVIAQKLEGK